MVRGISHRTKEYVGVNFDVDREGSVTPSSITLLKRNKEGAIIWKSKPYEIDEVIDQQPAPSRKVGGCGERFLIRIGEYKTYLFYENYDRARRFAIKDNAYGDDGEYVDANVDIDDQGKVVPRRITFYEPDEEGIRTVRGVPKQIDKVYRSCPGAELKSGGCGERFPIKIKETVTFLFYENHDPEARFFVERKVHEGEGVAYAG